MMCLTFLYEVHSQFSQGSFPYSVFIILSEQDSYSSLSNRNCAILNRISKFQINLHESIKTPKIVRSKLFQI